MQRLSHYSSVQSVWQRIDEHELSDSSRACLVAVGLRPQISGTGSALSVPSSHSRLLDWNRVGKQLERPIERQATLGLLHRLIDFRSYQVEHAGTSNDSFAWQPHDFLGLVGRHFDSSQPLTQELITKFEEGKPGLTDRARKFDKDLHLACCHFLYALLTDRKSLGMAAAESCYLYIEAVELLDREVKYPGYLPEAALAAGRHLLCDDQWNVVDGYCQLLFRPACEAMIRAIQIAVLESIATGPS